MKFRVLTVLSVILLSCSAYAAKIEKCDYNRDSFFAVVSGTTEKDEVTVSVKKDGKIFYEMQQTAENGKFNFTFPILEDIASYSVSVGESSNLNSEKSSFKCFGKDAASSVVSAYKEAAAERNIEKIKSVLKDNAEFLGIKAENVTDDLTEKMLNMKTVNSVTDIQNNFSDAYSVCTINNASDAAAIEKVILNNSDKLSELYPTVYKTYLSYKGAGTGFINQNYQTINDFYNDFEYKVLSYAINNAGGWADAKKIFEDNGASLGINLGLTSKISNISTFYIELMNTGYTDKKSITDAFNAAALKYSADKDSGSKGPSGGAGGSGGGGSVKGVKTIYDVVKDSEEKNSDAFSDMDEAEWAKPYVYELFSLKIVSGDGKNFRPNDFVKREEFIKMLVLTLGINAEETNDSFSDAGEGSWFKPYTDTAKKLGITNGIGDNRFGAGMDITREDLVALSYRAAKMMNVSFENNEENKKFDDAESISDYAREAAESFYCSKIIGGKSEGEICPKDNATRAETAKILCLLKDKIKSDNYVTE